MRYKTSTLYTVYEDWKQILRKLQKQIEAESRSRKRRPADDSVVLNSAPIHKGSESVFDWDYG